MFFFLLFLDGFLIPKLEPTDTEDNQEPPSSEHSLRQPQIRVSTFATQSANATNIVNALNQLQQQEQTKSNDCNDNVNGNDKVQTTITTTTTTTTPTTTAAEAITNSSSLSVWVKNENSKLNSNYNNQSASVNPPIFITGSLIDIKNNNNSSNKNDNNSSNNSFNNDSSSSVSGTPLTGQQTKTMRRRVRRKNNSPDDQAESLTEMSVRGLNLFRYASIQDGVYQCTECAKDNVQKTFKNKYSFQRHAFLYHEGTQRKVFPCPVCRKEFSRPDKMKNHMKTTHECYMPKDCNFPIPLIMGGAQASLNLPTSSTNFLNAAQAITNIVNLTATSQ